MSARYEAVGWNRSKIVYDAVLIGVILAYYYLFVAIGAATAPIGTPPDGPSLAMQASGSCAFLLLASVLAIGPLVRLDPRLLPFLYNRRHFGVITCAVAAGHAQQVLNWYFAFSPTPSLQAMLFTDTGFDHWPGLPFIPFGIAAFAILVALAATSHDFWLRFLTPPVWKALHMLIYLAFGLVVAHVAFGALQSRSQPLLAVLVTAVSIGLCALHLAAGRKAVLADRVTAQPADTTPWVVATTIDAIGENRGLVVNLPDAEAVAIFRHNGHLSAVSNLCAHQNGPLGEGRVVDGCITCPWHGFQYQLADGCAPAPFTERLATYRLRLDGCNVLLDPVPNPPGTYVAPTALPT